MYNERIYTCKFCTESQNEALRYNMLQVIEGGGGGIECRSGLWKRGELSLGETDCN